jgi:hypothetical protein
MGHRYLTELRASCILGSLEAERGFSAAQPTVLTYPFFLMTTTAYQTTIGTNEIGCFIGDGDCRIQFTQEEMDALILARVHAKSLADAFANYVSATLSSGEIPSCFRQDLSPEQVKEIKEELPAFQRNFRNAFFSLMTIFEF